MNRILLYVHFNKYGGLSKHVVYQLEKLRPQFNKVVFISNSPLSVVDKSRVQNQFDVFIQRENIGYDFAAWRDGINTVGWTELSSFDSLTLMNDTCFGPIYPISNVYSAMEACNVDFWGITDHVAANEGMPGNNGPMPHHIQSYMQVFSRGVIKSEAFQKFWESVANHEDVIKVIQEYETKLSETLCVKGFSFKVFFDAEEYSKMNNVLAVTNYSELQPIVLLNNGVPFLKIKAFLHTRPGPIFAIIKKTDYPLSLIKEHLKIMKIKNTHALHLRIKRRLVRYTK